MDRGAWQATVRGVTKSPTWLSHWTSTRRWCSDWFGLGWVHTLLFPSPPGASNMHPELKKCTSQNLGHHLPFLVLLPLTLPSICWDEAAFKTWLKITPLRNCPEHDLSSLVMDPPRLHHGDPALTLVVTLCCNCHFLSISLISASVITIVHLAIAWSFSPWILGTF